MLSSDVFDVRNEAREQLAQAGELALPALEDGARSSDLEVSISCLQLIDQLAQSDKHWEDALNTLERLVKDDSESTAARALSSLSAVREFHEDRNIQSAIDRLTSVGCRIDDDERAPGKPVTRISISGGGGFNDGVMAYVAAFPQLDALHLHGASITDAGMVHLARLRNLRHLALSHSPISDKGLAHIAELTGLEDLAIDDTQVTDDGLQVLQEFPRLNRLTLATDFHDRGVKHLAGIANLERLSLIGCESLTDAGLQALSSIKSLKHVAIYSRSEGITESGLKELQRSLPGLVIRGMR